MRRKTPARPDYLLISDTLKYISPTIKKKIVIGQTSCFMHKKNEFLKGKEIWKFNNFLLTEKEYIKIVKQIFIDI